LGKPSTLRNWPILPVKIEHKQSIHPASAASSMNFSQPVMMSQIEVNIEYDRDFCFAPDFCDRLQHTVAVSFRTPSHVRRQLVYNSIGQPITDGHQFEQSDPTGRRFLPFFGRLKFGSPARCRRMNLFFLPTLIG